MKTKISPQKPIDPEAIENIVCDEEGIRPKRKNPNQLSFLKEPPSTNYGLGTFREFVDLPK